MFVLVSISELVRRTFCFFLKHISPAVCLLLSVAEEQGNFKFGANIL